MKLLCAHLIIIIAVAAAFSQPTSSIEFYDSTGATATAKFGWTGDATNGNFYIETPGDGEPVKVQKGAVTVDGAVKAASFEGDGSKLTGVTASSTIADSSITTAKLADGSVTAAKLAAGVIPDSIAWTNIKGIPAGFADGTDNEGTASSSIADGSITTAKLADSAVTAAKLAANAVSAAKIADGAVTDSKIGGVAWSKISGAPISSDANGNVGIGTASPAAGLEVHSGTEFAMTQTSKPTLLVGARSDDLRATLDISLGITDGLRIENNGAVDSRLMARSATNTYTNLLIFDHENSQIEFPSGNVGIGTNAPASLLDVSGSVDDNWIAQFQNSGTTGPTANGLLVNTNGTGIPFQVSGANTMTFCITSARNVGIGNFAGSWPTAPLEIAPVGTDGAITEVLKLRSQAYNSVGTGERISFYTTTNLNAAIDGLQSYDNGNIYGKLAFSTRNAASGLVERMTIDYDGTVLVNGTLCGNSCSPSDRRYKKSISPLKSSMQKIRKLSGITYYWDRKSNPKKDFPKTRQIGLIAQDVEKVVPEVVHTDNKGYKSLSYDKLTVLLIEATKEQQEIIEAQKVEIENLKKRLSRIEQTAMTAE